MNVVGPRLGADHDYGLPVLPGPSFRRVCIESHDAYGGSRRHVQTVCKHAGRASGLFIELRVEIEIHLLGAHPEHRLLSAEKLLSDHVHGDPNLRLGSALAVPGLEKPQRSMFDREFEILHVSIVVLEPIGDLTEFFVGFRKPLRHHADVRVFRVPATTSSPCAFTRKSP